MSQTFQTDPHHHRPERVLLVGVQMMAAGQTAIVRHRVFESGMAEAADLVAAVGAECVGTISCQRDRAHAALFVGTGKAEEIAAEAARLEADVVVVNHALTPVQERNLEKVLQCRVLDRVGLILAIFAQRARSQEGKLQVELAQLNHLSSRLVRGYGHLQSQRGGIGMKGPGETRLETDRRLIGKRIDRLRKEIEQLRRQRDNRRRARVKNAVPTFALVGYTNAGKSTLFNRLTKADVLAKDLLFATLDTTARRLYLGEEVQIILTDTVGFVRDLPHQLVAAFAATLEETAQADVLLHVVDASHPEYLRQMEDVESVLKQIGADHLPQLLVYNKADLLPEPPPQAESGNGVPKHIAVSATTGLGLSELREAMKTVVQQRFQAA